MPLLSVNLGGVSAAQDFSYPDGDYRLKVAKVEELTTQDGQGTRTRVICDIILGPGASADLQGKPIYHSFANTQKSLPFMRRFCDACGIGPMIDANGGRIDTDWLVGREFVARVSKRKQQDGREFVNIDRERPIEAWTYGAGVAGGQPPQQMAPQPGMLQPMPQPQVPQQAQFQQPAPMPAPQAQPQQQYQQPQQPQQQYQQPQQQYQQPPMQPAPAAQPGALPMPMAPPQQQPAPGNAQPAQPQTGFPAPAPPTGAVPGQGQ